MNGSLSTPQILPFIENATSISQLQQAHAHILKTGLIHHPFTTSRLISSATNFKNLTYAHSIFSNTQHNQNTFNYNTMIKAYNNSSTPQIALHIFFNLLYDNVIPDKYTYTFVLKTCSVLRGYGEAQQFHAHVVKSGIGFDLFVYNTLVHVYAICGYFENARNLLDRMAERDVVSWNTVLSAYVNMGMVELARSVFDEMGERNVESWNFMISGYVNGGLVEEARWVFDEMEDRDVVSWNVMITGYARAGRFEEVLVIFEGMLRENVRPDGCTFVNVLSACGGIGALGQGKWVHAYIDRNGFNVSGFLATALVDMYSKCGSIEKALEVFRSTKEKDISTWNSMISGLSTHGLGVKALEIFSDLVLDGFKPNEVTFVCLLSACSRSGLLNEGREMFDRMVRVHDIQPTIEHYGCMVDLLGRFGLLEEAEELARKIPLEEGPMVWESLLGACRNYGDAERAERVSKRLLELDPQDSAAYVQLSNVKASMGRWDEVKEVRRVMRARGVTKEPACSMIEIDGVVHEFLAGEGMIS